MHILERQIELNVGRKTLWEYIATPANLDELTPPDLRFRIVSEVPGRMYEGMLIQYQIRVPFFGRRRWVTEIKHIREQDSFVDEQRIGPYRFWYHRHRVESLENGRTRMVDTVCYRLPLGIVGRLVHALLVQRMLERIFDYRAEKLRRRFPP